MERVREQINLHREQISQQHNQQQLNRCSKFPLAQSSQMSCYLGPYVSHAGCQKGLWLTRPGWQLGTSQLLTHCPPQRDGRENQKGNSEKIHGLS